MSSNLNQHNKIISAQTEKLGREPDEYWLTERVMCQFNSNGRVDGFMPRKMVCALVPGVSELKSYILDDLINEG